MLVRLLESLQLSYQLIKRNYYCPYSWARLFVGGISATL